MCRGTRRICRVSPPAGWARFLRPPPGWRQKAGAFYLYSNRSITCLPCGAYTLHQTWMKDAQFGCLTIGGAGRDFEPFAAVWQFHCAAETEFGRVAQARELVGCGFAVGDKELPGTELVCFPACSVGCQYNEMGCLIVKNFDDQSRPRFWPRLDPLVFGEVAPYDFAGFRSRPPMHPHD
jgi:hypothetical protein